MLRSEFRFSIERWPQRLLALLLGEAFLGLKKTLKGHVKQPLIEELGVALNDFEFDTAMTKLEQLARELNLNGGQHTHGH